MTDLKLASAADDIRIWDCNGYTLLKQYNPHSTDVSCIAWSQDNNFIASTSAAGDKVSVTCIKNSAYTITELEAGEDRTCVAFNSNSRYLLCGGKSGTLAIWDLKTHKLKKTYKEHTSAITSVSFNWNDTYIATGASNGDIILYNVISAHGSQPMTTPDTQAIQQLEYSRFKKSLLGAASDDGVVNLWDTNTRRLIHGFNQMHCASVTGLSFSPVNEMLMMSVGLDKRIVCYDVVGKNGVKTMTTDLPLSSIDIHPDGATVAIGTMKGKVLIYDLRYNATPIQTLNAHKSPVQMVRFMNTIKMTKDDNSTRSKSTRLNQIRKLHSTSTSPKTYMNGDTQPLDNGPKAGLTDRTNLEYNSPNKNEEKAGGCESELISPYKDGSLNKWDSTSENKPDRSDASVAGMGVLSPLAANGSTTSDLSRTSLNHSTSSNSPYLHSRSQSRGAPSPGGHSRGAPSPVRGGTSPKINGPSSVHEREKVPLSDPGNSSSSDSQSSTENHVTSQRLSANPMVERMKNSSPRGTSTPIAEIVANNNNHILIKTVSAPVVDSSTINQPVSLNYNTAHPPRTVLQTRNVQRQLSADSGITDWRHLTGVPDSQDGSKSKDYNKNHQTKLKSETPRSDTGYESSVDRNDKTDGGVTIAPGGHLASGGATLTSGAVPVASGGASVTSGGATGSSGGASLASGLASGAKAFQLDLLQSMISECMEEFQDEMRRDMMKLHVEMLRQFQIQQAEILNIVKQHSVNEELLAEIERLREENRRLKKTF